MDANIINAVVAIALGNTNAMLHLLLALEGLIGSDDIDSIAHSFTAPLDELAGDPSADRFRAILDAKLSPILAEVYEIARRAANDPETRG